MELNTAFQNMVNACKAIQLNWDQMETLKRSVEVVSVTIKKELEAIALKKEEEAKKLEENQSGAV